MYACLEESNDSGFENRRQLKVCCNYYCVQYASEPQSVNATDVQEDQDLKVVYNILFYYGETTPRPKGSLIQRIRSKPDEGVIAYPYGHSF